MSFFVAGERLTGVPGEFYDDFNGTTLDASKWTVYNRIADLVNSEVNGMVPSAVTVNNGLTITSSYVPAGFSIGDSETAPQTVYYASGQLHGNMLFRYGTAVIRAKVPAAAGTWPLFWMLGFEWQPTQPFTANTPGHNWPNAGWCEIDIVEFLNGSRTENNCAVHYGTSDVAGGALAFDATTRFMTYRLEWQSSLLRWSYDPEDGSGWQTLRTIVDPAKVPNVEMYPIISTAIGGAGGTPNSADYPSDYVIDYVRITR